MRASRSLVVVALSMLCALAPAASRAHPGTAHVTNGAGVAGVNAVVVTSADQALDTGTVQVGTTTVVLSCVEVIPTSSSGTHLVGMYGTGGGLQWTITIRETIPNDFIIVNNVPFAPPADANLCGIGNVGDTGAGLFTVV